MLQLERQKKEAEDEKAKYCERIQELEGYRKKDASYYEYREREYEEWLQQARKQRAEVR